MRLLSMTASASSTNRPTLNGSEGSQDVLQETFLAVARASKKYEPRGRFRPWIMRIARNLCLNRIEAIQAQRRVMAESPLRLIEPTSEEPEPSEEASGNEQARRLRGLVMELPERQRETMILYAFERMSYREMSEVLDVPVNTLKTLVHRARATLARRYEAATRGNDDAM